MMQPRASIFGGSWINDGNAGSRYANVDYWPDNSNDNLGARGRSDDGLIDGKASRTSLGDALRTNARRRSWSRRRTMARVRLAAFAQRNDQGLWSARVSCFGEHIARSGRAGRSGLECLSRPAAGFFRDGNVQR
jgi:hypothetical protein